MDEMEALALAAAAHKKKTANGGPVGQTAIDIAKSAGSGVARGAAGLLDTMRLPAQGMDWLLAKGATALMGDNAPEWTQTPLQARQSQPSMAEIVQDVAPFTAPAFNFEPQTTAGQFAQTAGEFVPGAVALGGGGLAGNAIRYGVIPGLASEAAGQATEGTQAEPYARIIAALAAGTLAGRPTGRARPAIPRADRESAKMAETLMQAGVRPTVGQTTQSRILKALEGSTDDVAGQADDFTRAAMKTTGSSAKKALPEALKAQSDDIVKGMNDAVDGIVFTPSTQMAQQADDVIEEYMRGTAQGSVVPDVRNIADEIVEAATNPNAAPLSLSTLKDWRSRLGRLMNSKDGQVREAAWGLRHLIDDATKAELQAAGRADDVLKLDTLRGQYRNWLAVADASTRAGAEAGVISPTQLNQSVIRSQGRRNAAIGNTTELGGLARAGAGVLRPEPTVRAGGVRTLPASLSTGAIGAAAGSALSPANPLIGAALGGVAGMGATSIGQALMRSTPIQSTLMDPAAKIARALLATGPGAISQR